MSPEFKCNCSSKVLWNIFIVGYGYTTWVRNYVCRKHFLILLLTRLMTELNYLLRATHSNDTRRGGVCMYFKEHFPILRRENVCNLPENLITEIRMGKKKCFFTCLYRSPNRVLTSLIHSFPNSIWFFFLILMI